MGIWHMSPFDDWIMDHYEKMWEEQEEDEV
jgi:hypothetical protein